MVWPRLDSPFFELPLDQSLHHSLNAALSHSLQQVLPNAVHLDIHGIPDLFARKRHNLL